MNPTILIPRKGWTVWDALKGLQDMGWKHGRMAKAYVAGDLVGAQKTILLCPMCKHGFDWKKHDYYNVAHYEQIHAQGNCDVCKQHSNKLELYLHEAYRPGCWATRDEQRARSQKSIHVGF
jgi:hypothetical protein